MPPFLKARAETYMLRPCYLPWGPVSVVALAEEVRVLVSEASSGKKDGASFLERDVTSEAALLGYEEDEPSGARSSFSRLP